MSWLDTKAPLVLLYRDIEALPDVPRYDLMLTPQFYVIKRETLPIKYAFQAKKLAPSVLEELVGEGQFAYEVFRDEEAWSFIAYDVGKLTEFLADNGSSIDQVGRLYFAEQAKSHCVPPIALNAREALSIVNETVTVVPTSLLNASESLGDFDERLRPAKHFTINRASSSYLGTKQAITVASLIGVLGASYFVEGYRYQHALGSADATLNKTLEANPALQGAYARQSIHKKYMAINTTQRAIRDRLKAIGRLTSKETKIDTLLIDVKGYRAVLAVPNKPKIVRSLKALAKTGHLENTKFGSGNFETSGAFQ